MFGTTQPDLSFTTGHPHAGATLRQVVDGCERVVPGQILGYYVTGSYADGTDLATSDLDLIIVTRTDDESTYQAIAGVLEQVEYESPIEVDPTVVPLTQLQRGADPLFKLGSRFVYGEDIRDVVPFIPIEEWARERMHASYYLMVKVFERPPIVRLPLGCPDPDGEFFGYVNRQVPLEHGRSAASTRNMIRVTGWIATALLAFNAGTYVTRKADCHVLYRKHIGDEWSSLLEDIYDLCRTEWGYLIPEEVNARARLRAICRRVLRFENHFLSMYKRFLIAELTRDPDVSNRAIWLMNEIPFDDTAVLRARLNPVGSVPCD